MDALQFGLVELIVAMAVAAASGGYLVHARATRRAAREGFSSAQLSAFFEHAPVGLAIHDLEGRYVYASSVTQQMYGMTDAELKNRSMQSISHIWPDAREIEDTMAQVAQGEVRRLLKPLHSPGEEEPFYFDVIMFPIRDASGAVVQIGALGSDVTALKRAEAAALQREAQLESLFEHIPASISIFDDTHHFLMVNQSAAQAYSLSPKDMVGRTADEFVRNWDEGKQLIAIGDEVFADGKSRRLQTTFHPPSGDPTILDSILFPIRSDDGTVVQVGFFRIDVSKQVNAEATVIQREAQLSSLFEHIPADIAIFARDHRFVLVNQSAADGYGLQAADLVGTLPAPISDHWTDGKALEDLGEQVFLDGIPRRLMTTFHPPGKDSAVNYDSMFFPIRSDDGEIIQVGHFRFDVTKQIEAEKALEEQREQGYQSEKLAALGQLLAGVAHELNNPLTVVVGRSSILAEKFQGTPHERALSELREAAERCNRIVRTFLAMARQSAPRRAGVSINATLDAALDMVAYNFRSQGIELKREFESNLPEVDADEDQLVQVFTNILINAGQALQDREESARIAVRSRTSSGKAIVEIADNGPGIPEEVVSRIFEPFFTTKKVGEGTGMGLSMAKGIIEEHGGTLTHRAPADGGAIFAIELPLRQSTSKAHPATPKAEPEPAPTPVKARVLIVDDEPAIRSMLGEILAKVGMDCEQAANGAEGLSALEARSFDLIFCDVRMPVMDGMRFRQHLADSHPDMLERLVYMSGDVLQRSGERYAPIAMHQIIDKPFRPSEVREIALALLNEKGLHP